MIEKDKIEAFEDILIKRFSFEPMDKILQDNIEQCTMEFWSVPISCVYVWLQYATNSIQIGLMYNGHYLKFIICQTGVEFINVNGEINETLHD